MTTVKPTSSLGEQTVRLQFNPSKSDLVDRIKGLHGQLIDLVNELQEAPLGKLESHAVQQSMDALQMSSMMAVYAATSEAVQKTPRRVTAMPEKATLLPHQVRVTEELEGLAERRRRLAEFFDTETYAQLPIKEQQRLRRQFVYMTEYQFVLGERIAAF